MPSPLSRRVQLSLLLLPESRWHQRPTIFYRHGRPEDRRETAGTLDETWHSSTHEHGQLTCQNRPRVTSSYATPSPRMADLPLKQVLTLQNM